MSNEMNFGNIEQLLKLAQQIGGSDNTVLSGSQADFLKSLTGSEGAASGLAGLFGGESNDLLSTVANVASAAMKFNQSTDDEKQVYIDKIKEVIPQFMQQMAMMKLSPNDTTAKEGEVQLLLNALNSTLKQLG